MAVIPNGYVLDKHCDKKLVESDEYVAWTVADIKEIIADLPDDAPVWWSTYDEDSEELIVHPFEIASTCGDEENPYAIFG
jgi:hypothetical protein